ncbi:MAG: class I SAM-dependent methyltransferase [Victivallaceae bacterium]|nr:class I SAM-dependent methyltransferase [Victivallaceae bacterium]
MTKTNSEKTAAKCGLNEAEVRNALRILRQMPESIRKFAICGGPATDGPWWTNPEPTECYYSTILAVLMKLGLTEKDILEVGCDSGYFVRALLFHGANAVGLDKNKDAVTNVKGLKLLHGQIEDPPEVLRKMQFDAVISKLVFTPDCEPIKLRALESINKLLRPGGYFISQDDPYSSIFTRKDFENTNFEVILHAFKWNFRDYYKDAVYYDEYEYISICRKPGECDRTV